MRDRSPGPDPQSERYVAGPVSPPGARKPARAAPAMRDPQSRPAEAPTPMRGPGATGEALPGTSDGALDGALDGASNGASNGASDGSERSPADWQRTRPGAVARSDEPGARPAPPPDATGPIRQVVAQLDTLSDQDPLELEHIVEAFGQTAFLPVLIVLALIVVSPLSGIPLLPTLFGTMIGLVSLQMLVGRRRLWLPGVLMRRRVSGERLHRALTRLKGIADWLDRNARARLSLLVRPPLDILPKAACAVSGLAMPFLELVPFSSSILGLAVILFATGMITRDGLYTLLGYLVMSVAAMVPLAVYGGLWRAAAG